MNTADTATPTWPERILTTHAPALVEHLGLAPREWADLQTKADARMDQIADRIPDQGELTVPKNLIDHAFMIEVDRLRETNRALASASFLKFIDAQVLELIGKVPPALVPRLRLEMRDLFINFSFEQSKYKEKLGELLATNRLLQRLGAVLIGLEVPIADRRTTLDAALALPSQKVLTVEILNVQLRDDRIEDDASLMALIDRRVTSKVQQKLGKDIADAAELDFPLQLVVWFERAETLARYGPVLASRGLNCPFELPICTLQLLSDGLQQFEWRFGSIAELLRPY